MIYYHWKVVFLMLVDFFFFYFLWVLIWFDLNIFSSTYSNKLEYYRPILIRLLGLSVGCNYQPLASNQVHMTLVSSEICTHYVGIALRVGQILLILMCHNWKADIEVDRPMSHCCLTPPPKVQVLVKMALMNKSTVDN